MKPGFIIGNLTTGIANIDDFLWRIVAGCVTMGYFPEEPIESSALLSSLDGLAANTVDYLNSASERMTTVKSLTIRTSRFCESINAALAVQLTPKPVQL
jgi:thioester reductase-like protein